MTSEAIRRTVLRRVGDLGQSGPQKPDQTKDLREWRLRRYKDGIAGWTVDLQRHPSHEHERIVTVVPKRTLTTERHRTEVAEGERDEARAALSEFAQRIEDDRREPDKLLCHVLSMRRSALTASQEETPA